MKYLAIGGHLHGSILEIADHEFEGKILRYKPFMKGPQRQVLRTLDEGSLHYNLIVLTKGSESKKILLEKNSEVGLHREIIEQKWEQLPVFGLTI